MRLNWRRRRTQIVARNRDISDIYRISVGKSAVEIGRFTYGVDKMRLQEWGEGANLTIGAFCSIARELNILLGGNHRTDWITTFPFGHVFPDKLGTLGIAGHPQTRGDVVIGNDVWIGENVTIFSGVAIGDGAVISANATVTQNIGTYEIWGGNPAKLIRPRFDPEIVSRLTRLQWWALPIETIREIAPILSQPPTVENIERLLQL